MLTDGNINCWGNNKQQQCSNVTVGYYYTDISAGDYHTCGLTVEGLVFCWGNDRSYQVSTTPKYNGFIDVSAGGNTCALDKDGKIQCWGRVSVNSDIPEGSFKQVISGDCDGCVLDTLGSVFCWSWRIVECVTITIKDKMSPP
eukprot:UN31508